MKVRFLEQVAMALLLSACAAQAQLSFVLNSPSQNGTALNEIDFAGTLVNLGRTNLYLNDVQWVLIDSASKVLVVESNTFFANVPGIISRGGSYSDVVFGIHLGPAAPPGVYKGTITIFGGSNIFVTSNLANASFQITLPDSVGDGIPDWWRQLYFGGDGSITNSESCDTCGGGGTGANNHFKYVVGLDPTRTSSVFTLNVTNYPLPALWFGPVAAGRIVIPECTDDLDKGQWTNLVSPISTATNGGWYLSSDPNLSATQRFYRVEISLP